MRDETMDMPSEPTPKLSACGWFWASYALSVALVAALAAAAVLL